MKNKKFLSIIMAALLSVNISAGAISAAETDDEYDVVDTENVDNSSESDGDVEIDSDETDAADDTELEVESDEESVEEIAGETWDDGGVAVKKEDNLDIDDSISNELDDSVITYAQTDGNMVGGYVPSDEDLNVPEYISEISSNIDLPSSFPDDMSSYYQTYPTNRNQGSYGTCWSFAGLGLAEFDLINKGYCDSTVDLSELQLAYFNYNFVQDPLGGTAGDSVQFNKKGNNTYLSYGGNFKMAARRLSQWIGATSESVVPYSKAASTLSSGLDSSYAYNYDQVHLRDVYVLNINTNTDEVKENIMNHGAVGVIYYHKDSNMAQKNSGDWTYYNPNEKDGTAHAVMIVGWDDNYSTDNFPDDNKPTSNGAWLVRNSWGSYVSYFWMSYENKAILNSAWVFDAVSADDDEYDNNYQLDGGMDTTYYTSDKINSFANIFTVNKKDNVHVESLKAVSLSFLSTADVGYSIDIYTDLTDMDDPTSGTLQESAHTEGRTTYAGIYTVKLSDPVTLKSRSSYSVVVTTDKPGLNIESGKTYSKDSTTVFKANVDASNGRSFYKCESDEEFTVKPTVYSTVTTTAGNTEERVSGNFCIKAFTSNIEGNHVPGEAVTENKTDSTCAKEGSYELVTYCTVCGEETSRVKKSIEKKAHTYNAVVYQKSGVSKTCKVCKTKTTVNYTGIHKAADNSYYYYKKGKVATGSEDIVKNGSTWYYINKNGKVDYSFTGVAKNKNGTFYIYKGKVSFTKNGLVQSKGTYNGWYYVKKGKVQLGKENIIKNNNTWYYINKNGRVDFSFKGIASNSNGTWYLEKGRVNFKKNIKRYKDPRTKHYYKVVKGRATRIK